MYSKHRDSKQVQIRISMSKHEVYTEIESILSQTNHEM